MLCVWKRQHFWRAKIDVEKSSPRQLWRSIDALLGRGRVPPVNAISAEHFHRFFDDKAASVRSATAGTPPPLFQSAPGVASFQHFQPVSVDDVVAVVRALPDKSCESDALPTNLLKAVVDIIAPFLTNLFNSSLANGLVPEAFKAAFISPRLKKSGMDPVDVRSYRPISNLSVVSKLLERLVARQLLAHLDMSGLLPRLQSAYRSNHSTETAVLKVLSDILLAIDAGDLSALVLLDLSAVGKTVSACFAVLRQLRSVRRSLPRSILQSLVTSLVLSRLDYGNATLAGISTYLLQRFQSAMNSAVWLVFSSSKFAHSLTSLRFFSNCTG